MEIGVTMPHYTEISACSNNTAQVNVYLFYCAVWNRKVSHRLIAYLYTYILV